MSVPKVSAIVTCYNYGQYLATALDSILKQTRPIDEIVIVNDGSTDNTREVVRRYLNDPRFRYVEQKNLGQTVAKNVGIKVSTGDYVAFLDADDSWSPDKIKKQMKLFQDPRVGMVYTRQIFVNSDGNKLERQPNRLPCFKGKVTSYLLKDNFIPFSSSVVKKACFDEWGLFNENYPMSIDWDLWLRFSLHTRIDYVNEDLLYYRVDHEGQMSKNVKERTKWCERIFDAFIENNKSSLLREHVRQAKIYTYNTRGFSTRQYDPAQSWNYYKKSLKEKPFQVAALKGLALALLPLAKKKGLSNQ